MIRNLLLSAFLFLALFAGAQRNCVSFEHLQQQLIAFPQMAQELQKIERFTQSRAGQNTSGINMRGTPVYTIPVVVHVLWNTTSQNISDAQIQSQIDVLNQDFQLLNSDTGLVPAAFKSAVADCQVQFCMAKRDPAGNATNGIVRKQTSKTSFSADTDDAKYTSKGGDDIWDASKYLNLWVVPDITSGGSGGILGYAQFPGGPAATDGVVVGYKYFGTSGTVVAPFNKGRTTTHEVGHWLNLRHIWGDESACSQDDLVTDTPLQADKNFGCPSFPKVDACTSGDGVMFMNYMDYVDDACMYMFTNGQKSRMYGVLQSGGFRASLSSSNGCVAPSSGCGSAYEPNESLSAAAAVSTNTNLSAAITTTTDKDWFKVSITTASNFNITLTNLVADFDIILYNAAGTEIARSENGGTTSEKISTSGSKEGTYYIQVFGYNGANSSTCYTLNVGATVSCPGPYDISTNGSMSGAAEIPFGTNIKGTISSSTDVDYYKFKITTGGSITLTLSTLPADFDLKLFNGSGSQVAISQNGSTNSETINYTAAAGTYYAQVYGYNGASSSSCYTLKVALGTATRTDASYVQGTGKAKIAIFPNPASKALNVAVTGGVGKAFIRITDISGRRLSEQQVIRTNNEVDLQKLSKGVYIVQVIGSAGELLYQSKFVKQ